MALDLALVGQRRRLPCPGWRVTSTYDRSSRCAAGEACHARRVGGRTAVSVEPDPAGLVRGAGRRRRGRARYYSKVYWRGRGQCAFFLGALSSGGHGRFAGGYPAGRSGPASKPDRPGAHLIRNPSWRRSLRTPAQGRSRPSSKECPQLASPAPSRCCSESESPAPKTTTKCAGRESRCLMTLLHVRALGWPMVTASDRV